MSLEAFVQFRTLPKRIKAYLQRHPALMAVVEHVANNGFQWMFNTACILHVVYSERLIVSVVAVTGDKLGVTVRDTMPNRPMGTRFSTDAVGREYFVAEDGEYDMVAWTRRARREEVCALLSPAWHAAHNALVAALQGRNDLTVVREVPFDPWFLPTTHGVHALWYGQWAIFQVHMKRIDDIDLCCGYTLKLNPRPDALQMYSRGSLFIEADDPIGGPPATWARSQVSELLSVLRETVDAVKSLEFKAPVSPDDEAALGVRAL